SEEHTSELQSLTNLVCRLLLEKQRPSAPSRQAARARQPLQSAFAASTSSGASAKNSSGSSVQGRSMPCGTLTELKRIAISSAPPTYSSTPNGSDPVSLALASAAPVAPAMASGHCIGAIPSRLLVLFLDLSRDPPCDPFFPRPRLCAH